MGRDRGVGAATALALSVDIATDPENATDVAIVFHQLAGTTTRVEIEHGGWDRLGEMGQDWRDANRAGWDGVLPAYEKAATG